MAELTYKDSSVQNDWGQVFKVDTRVLSMDSENPLWPSRVRYKEDILMRGGEWE